MSLTKFKLAVSTVTLGLVATLAITGQPPASTGLQDLPPDQTLEREIVGAETHRYKIDLKANEFFQVRVEQKGVDVALKLSDASGNALATMDSPNGKEGFETLSLVASKAGNFILEISGFDTKAEKGIYTIKREASRTATEKDKRRVEVERAFVEGMTARNTDGQRDIASKKLNEALVGWEELEDSYLKELTAQQLKQFAQVPAEINAAIEKIKQELQIAQSLLTDGQKLMTKSKDDSLPARVKLSEALTTFRSVNAKVRDKNLLDKVSQSGGTASQSLNVLKIFEFYSKSGEALSLNGIAQTHANLGERQESIASLKQAVGVYGEIISDKTFPSISGTSVKETISSLKFNHAAGLGSIGHDLDNYFGKSEEGLEYLIQAVERYRSLYQETQNAEMKLQEARTLTFIGTIYGREPKNNDKAIEFLTKSLEVYQSLKNQDEEAAGVLSIIGTRQSLKYAFRDALENWEKALAVYRVIDYKHGQSNILRQIALMYWVLNNRSKVIEYTDQHLAVLQSPDFAENWKKILNAKRFGIYDELYGALIEHTRLENIAFAYRIREDYQKSLEYYEKAAVVAPSLKEPRTLRADLRSVAYSFAKLERWEKAAQFYEQALELSRKQGVREEIADDLQDVGWALLEAGRTSEALQNQNESLSINQSIGVGENRAFSISFSNLLNEIGRSHFESGNRRLAIFYGKRAINAMQGERQRLQNLDPISQKGFLEKKEKHYRRLSDWLIAEGRILEAEQVLAMLKEEEILSYLHRDASEIDTLQQRTDLRPEERDALKRYNEVADKIATLGAEFGALRQLQSKGVTLTVEQDKRYTELSAQLEAANRAFQVFLRQLAEEFAKRTNTGKDVQENLALQPDLKDWGGDVVFLYTLTSEDRYRVILVTSNTQVDGKTEIEAADLNDKIQKFREAVQDPRVDTRALGKELYDILIKPVEKHLEGAKTKTLLWSLDGNLRLLPLAALWDGTQYFGQKYQNVTVTLASRTRLGDAVAPNWRALGLGVSEAKQVREPNGTRELSFKSLPAVRAELRSIVQSEQSPNGILPGQSLLDAEFNENALEAQLLRGYQVVHVASHFSLNPGDSTRSFLLLGDGNILTVDKIKNNPKLSFKGVELLTLSACQTAVVEKDSSGKEIEGFGYVAQQKGAKAILATLWSVSDESTQLLMSEFYRLRKTNPKLTKSQALQMAQKQMLEGKLQSSKATAGRRDTGEMSDSPPNTPRYVADPNRPYAHPYYWAPFILIGNWR